MQYLWDYYEYVNIVMLPPENLVVKKGERTGSTIFMCLTCFYINPFDPNDVFGVSNQCKRDKLYRICL